MLLSRQANKSRHLRVSEEEHNARSVDRNKTKL